MPDEKLTKAQELRQELTDVANELEKTQGALERLDDTRTAISAKLAETEEERAELVARAKRLNVKLNQTRHALAQARKTDPLPATPEESPKAEPEGEQNPEAATETPTLPQEGASRSV